LTWWIISLVIMCLYSFIVIPCALFAYCFLVWSLYLVLRGETSYEHDYRTADRALNSRGCCGNFQQIFGKNPALWLIPTLVPTSNELLLEKVATSVV
jgi:hypothetical protein